MPSTRVKQVAIGSAVILACGGVIIALSLLRQLPGFTGEFFGKLAGILSTPLLMEISIGLLGFLALLAVNHIRREREGDEFVFLEEVGGSGTATLARIEGLIDAGDHETAAKLLADLGPERLHAPEVLALRLRLAEAGGREDPPSRPGDPLGTDLPPQP